MNFISAGLCMLLLTDGWRNSDVDLKVSKVGISYGYRITWYPVGAIELI